LGGALRRVGGGLRGLGGGEHFLELLDAGERRVALGQHLLVQLLVVLARRLRVGRARRLVRVGRRRTVRGRLLRLRGLLLARVHCVVLLRSGTVVDWRHLFGLFGWWHERLADDQR